MKIKKRIFIFTISKIIIYNIKNCFQIIIVNMFSESYTINILILII